MSQDRNDEQKQKPEPLTVEQRLQRIEESLASHFDLKITTQWMERYERLDDAVTKDSIKSMKAMIHEFITKEHSAEILIARGADGFDRWIEQLLITQRIYEYLLFVNGFIRAFPSPDRFPDGEFAARRWLRELCWRNEFRIVHIRQGGYYPDFTRVANKALLREARRADSFADSFEVLVKESRQTEVEKAEDAVERMKEMRNEAREMRGCASIAAGALAYEEFLEDEEKDPKRYREVLDLAKKRRYLPLDQENFGKMWREIFQEAAAKGLFPAVQEDFLDMFNKSLRKLDSTATSEPN